MHILLAGDTHGSLAQIMYLAQIARNRGCDAIFVLGDFGAWEHMPDGVKFFDGCSKFAKSSGVPIYFLRGNHDKSSLVEKMYEPTDDCLIPGAYKCREGLYYVPDGTRWNWDGVRLMAFGGAYSVDKDSRLYDEQEMVNKVRKKNRYRIEHGLSPRPVPDFSGTLWFPEEEATDSDVSHMLQDETKIDILLTHDKPISSTPGWNRKSFDECKPNAQRVQRIMNSLHPALTLHGHLHYRYTDHVLTGGEGDRTYCRVEGLQADAAAGQHIPGYKLEDSWLVLITDESGEWDLLSE